jgi:hypothetical protein
VVTLKAGDMLEFRGKGKRFKYEVPLAACYNLALIYTIHQRQKEKVAKWSEDKKHGSRARRPRSLPKFFNQKLYEALQLK